MEKTQKKKKKKTPNEQLWRDILDVHYGTATEEEVLKKYEGKYAVSQLTIRSYDIQKRFKTMNKGKNYEQQIKPYNFMTTGVSFRPHPVTRKPIVPMLPYTSRDSPEYACIPYMPFTDYKAGEKYDNRNMERGWLWTDAYWKPMAKVVKDYMRHAEAKSEGDKNTTGELKRRHMVIDDTSIRYVGKETNDLEENDAMGLAGDSDTGYIDWNMVISNLTYDLAAMAGISKRNFSYVKRKVKNNEPIVLRKKTKQKLIKLRDL